MKNTFKHWLEQRYTPQTVKTYLFAVETYRNTPKSFDIEHADYPQIFSYLRAMRDKDWTANYIQTCLMAIKAYYKFLVHTGHRPDNPARDILLNDTKKAKNRKVDFHDLFSPQELELLLDYPSRYTLMIARNKLIISLYIYQGLTTGELVRLTPENIDFDEETVFVKASTTHNSRILELKENQLDYAYRYVNWDRERLLKSHHPQLFISKLGTGDKGKNMHYLISAQRSLFPDRTLNPMTIRQSVIVNWFKHEHLPVKEVQTRAGHKWPMTTEQYKPTDISGLKDAMSKYHPMG